MATLHCEVNIETKTIRCGFPDLFSGGRETEVENDGTFHFATADGHSSDYVSGSGSIKYGGRDIRIDDLYTQGCEVASETNRTLYGRRTHYVAATGAVR